ncbi:hypothetical protein CMU04_06300 [Elizabethkingia anophelis]|uniref:hypothetical protein n=1 Tax=Elizabethkingia anophelis TaxID=1117645 RepID=UPI0024049F56|nr:hypothetical protein [Elizabethkingia anophelis]MDV3882927.1 hypothetical protein [Elizabethkingia anophelis]
MIDKALQAACDYLSIEGVQLIKLQAFIDGYKQGSYLKPLIDNIDLVIIQLNNLINVEYLVEKGSIREEEINRVKREIKNLNSLKEWLNSTSHE